jgi:integrase
MRIYKRGNIYWLAFERDKKLYQYSLKTKSLAEAKKALRNIQAASAAKTFDIAVKILRDLYGVGDTGKTPLEDVWSIYLQTLKALGKNQVAPKTLHDRKSAVENFVIWINKTIPDINNVQQITSRIASQYASVLAASGKATKTRKNILANLNTVWTIAAKSIDNLTSPWNRLAPAQIDSVRRLAFTLDEEKRILEIAKKDDKKTWYYISILARYTGLRYGDCATITWADIDLENNIISVIPNKTAKHRIKVVLPIVAPLKNALLEIVKKDTPNAYLFPAHAFAYDEGKGSYFLKQNNFAAILKEAGLDTRYYTFHSWRHTLRTRLAEAGVSTETAMRICGHTTAEMSRHYDHDLHIEELRDALTKTQ